MTFRSNWRYGWWLKRHASQLLVSSKLRYLSEFPPLVSVSTVRFGAKGTSKYSNNDLSICAS